MKTKNRFSAVKMGPATWKVRDAQTGAYWDWEGRTREEARKFADAKNAKEKLRTAEIVSIEPLLQFLARQRRTNQ